jgi:6-pyruvoyltetrahydropterin/6-carboxytetrahydropterin synthase
MEIFKEFSFDSAHFLPNVPDDHKCKRMHGHTYRVRICLQGELDPHLGWVEDFGVVKGVWKPVEKMLDHYTLNDIKGLENPTAEQIAIWIWRKLKPDLPKLIRVEVFETPSSGVIYRGEYE